MCAGVQGSAAALGVGPERYVYITEAGRVDANHHVEGTLQSTRGQSPHPSRESSCPMTLGLADSTYYSCRGPKFGSLQSWSAAHTCLELQLQRIQVPLLVPEGTFTHLYILIHRHANIYMIQNKCNIKISKWR